MKKQNKKTAAQKMVNLLFKLVSFGNRKLPKNTMIFNFRPAHNCPAEKLGLCKVCNICYAKKAEIFRPAVLPYRIRQEKYFAKNTAYNIALDFCDIIARKKYTKYPVNALRFSEAGDFKTQSEIDKFTEICRQIKNSFPALIIYGYSARRDLDFSGLMEYATIQGSSFMLSNQFTAVKEIDKSRPYCPGSCKKCNLCQFPHKLNIQVKMH